MAVSTGQIVKRQGRDGGHAAIGVAAGKIIYEGTAVFLDAGGDATDVKVDANTIFAGIARETVDNSAGADGDKQVEVWTDGDFELTIAGTLADSEIGTAVYASDNYTFNQTSTANVAIGKLMDRVNGSTSVGVVRIKGLGVT